MEETTLAYLASKTLLCAWHPSGAFELNRMNAFRYPSTHCIASFAALQDSLHRPKTGFWACLATALQGVCMNSTRVNP